MGGQLVDRDVLEPSLLDQVTPEMAISNTEVFGPVIGVAPYDSFDQAVRLANNSRYGLQAGVFTSDISTALRAADQIDFGGVLINEVPAFRTDQQPYGGMRDSGNTREGPAYAIEEMTERRVIIIQG
jgi:acyl-CoA reductase-like NAD-dependent aldehyde dehydrogenase